jgi:hypothetical protein
MRYTKSLPNQRLRNDEDRVQSHLNRIAALYVRQISALQGIVEKTKKDLQEVSSLDIPKDIKLQKILLDDIMNCCKFGSEDLDVYFDYMCDILGNMRENVNSAEETKSTIRDDILECEKTISALLTIISSSKTLLDDEVTQSERFLQENADIDGLIDDAQATCKYRCEDLEVFCGLMDANMYNLQKA